MKMYMKSKRLKKYASFSIFNFSFELLIGRQTDRQKINISYVHMHLYAFIHKYAREVCVAAIFAISIN